MVGGLCEPTSPYRTKGKKGKGLEEGGKTDSQRASGREGASGNDTTPATAKKQTQKGKVFWGGQIYCQGTQVPSLCLDKALSTALKKGKVSNGRGTRLIHAFMSRLREGGSR